MSDSAPAFRVQVETITFDPAAKRATQDGGPWPHGTGYHFYEAAAAVHFTMLGYHVLRDYLSTRTRAGRVVTSHFSSIFHEVVGPEASEFFLTHLESIAPASIGQPDLFVFRDSHANDSRVHFPDPRLWFFVEVKGLGDQVRDTQKRFWREVALREDIGLGPDRIRLVSVVPVGTQPTESVIEY